MSWIHTEEGMSLDKLWSWEKRKVNCPIAQESGNPVADDLRERLVELVGGNLSELLADMKKRKMAQSRSATGEPLVGNPDYETDKKFREILNRKHVLGATEQALEKVDEHGNPASMKTLAQKNHKKMFSAMPKLPPKRILLEIQRERSRPLILPNYEERIAAAARLERKLAKQRAARKAGSELTGAGKGDTKAITDDTLDRKTDRMTMHEVFRRFLPDDLFPERPQLSEQDEMKERGLLYLARTGSKGAKERKSKDDGDDPDEKDPSEEKVVDEKPPKEDTSTTGQEATTGEGDAGTETRRPSTMRDEVMDALTASGDVPGSSDAEAKLYCATALCNWARNQSNAPRLAAEGAVRAIMRLSLESIPTISFFCGGAFRFMSDSLVLANQMIDDGAISIINDMVKRGGLEDNVVGNLTIALVNLTRVSGKEGQVVEATIHQAFTNILTTNPDLGPACARGLYNLTCVDSTYPLIEKVSRALIQLSSTSTVQNVKHICAAALCNLADLKAARMRLVEEGVIGVLGSLSKGSETRTRRVCAVILQNLSASKACRVEMVSRGSVQAAHSLSSDTDPIILRCIGLTLSRLASEPANASRIIHELGIAALCNIAVKYPTIPGISQPVASAFQLLAANSSSHIRISVVQEGSVAAIAALLRNSTDVLTYQHCLLALCNLLYEPDNHLSIVQQGLIVTLINLSTHENEVLKDLCALAFLNLSCAEESRKNAVNGGAVVAIIRLATQPSKVTKARCAASLCNLSAAQGNGMERMVDDGVIPALVGLITAEDIETVRYACAALCRLCATKENGNLILRSGAVPTLVQRAIKGDSQTQQYCGAVLSSLSFYESCRVRLFEMDIISALKKLAEVNDSVTKQRCLAAFANLSCEESIQLKMVDQGVVAIISRLADSYQEINYTCCARALCNLACADEARLRVATEGGFEALMMISMVRSVDLQTKLLCVIALCNLLDDCTVEYILNEGLVGSVANLSKISDSDTTHLCATLMNQLTYYLPARLNITEKVPILLSLFAMTDATRAETRIMAARTTANLVLCPIVGSQTLEAGALNALAAGILSLDDEAALHCLKAVFYASSQIKFLTLISRSTLPLTMCRYIRTCNDERHVLGVMTITLLLWDVESRAILQQLDLAEALVRVIADNIQPSTRDNLSLCLRYFCLGYPNHKELLDVHVLEALHAIYASDDLSGEVISRSIASVVRALASNPDCVQAIATIKTISMLKQVAEICTKDKKTLYDVAVALYHFAAASTNTRQATASSDMVIILDIISRSKECAELVTNTMCYFLTDSKSRFAFTNREIAGIIVRIITSNPTNDIACNAVSCVFVLSKRAHCRDFLTDAPLHTDMHLLKLSQSDDPKIKANCTRTLKNMTSDSTEALEEGAVANLIAMSLDGKERTIINEDLDVPTIIPPIYKDDNVPDCVKHEISDVLWFEEKMLVTGGPAGKGPDPPEPPPVDQDDSSQYTSIMDEPEGNEADSKTKMAFAKMQAPQALREACVLTDADFETIRDDLSDDGQPAAPTSQELLEASLSYELTLEMPSEDEGDKMGNVSRKSGEGSGHRSGGGHGGHKRDRNTVREGRTSREAGYAGARSPTTGLHHSSTHRDSVMQSSSHGRTHSRHGSTVGTPTASTRKSTSGASTPTGGRTPREVGHDGSSSSNPKSRHASRSGPSSRSSGTNSGANSLNNSGTEETSLHNNNKPNTPAKITSDGRQQLEIPWEEG